MRNKWPKKVVKIDNTNEEEREGRTETDTDRSEVVRESRTPRKLIFPSVLSNHIEVSNAFKNSNEK